MRSKMERKYVEFFCENCGHVEFEGVVFGQDRSRHLQAESGTRVMFCDRCKPKKIQIDTSLSSWFTDPDAHPL